MSIIEPPTGVRVPFSGSCYPDSSALLSLNMVHSNSKNHPLQDPQKDPRRLSLRFPKWEHWYGHPKNSSHYRLFCRLTPGLSCYQERLVGLEGPLILPNLDPDSPDPGSPYINDTCFLARKYINRTYIGLLAAGRYYSSGWGAALTDGAATRFSSKLSS